VPNPRALAVLALTFSLACFEDPEDVDDETSAASGTESSTGHATLVGPTTSGASAASSSATSESGGSSTTAGDSDTTTSTGGEVTTEGGPTSTSASTTGSTSEGPQSDASTDASEEEEVTSDADATSESTGTEVLPGRCDTCDSGFCTLEGECAWAVFATSEQFSAGFGGLTGGDMWCNTLADQAGLPGRYMAWLSDSTLHVGYRLIGHSEPYVLVNGTQVAENFSVFVTHDYENIDRIYLEHAIDRDEYGMTPSRGTACQAYPSALPVFTGTMTNGRWDFEGNCGEWTDETTTDELSLANARTVDSFWTIGACIETDCSRTASLYCFQTEGDD